MNDGITFLVTICNRTIYSLVLQYTRTLWSSYQPYCCKNITKIISFRIYWFNCRPIDQDDDDDSFDGLSEDSDTAHLKPRRQYWANKMQFVLACIGYSVGNSRISIWCSLKSVLILLYDVNDVVVTVFIFTVKVKLIQNLLICFRFRQCVEIPIFMLQIRRR